MGKQSDQMNPQPDGAVDSSKPSGLGQRHIFLLMSFLGLVVAYMLRVILFVAVVTMVNATALDPPRNGSAITTPATTGDTCPAEDSTNKTKKQGEFVWNDSNQGLVLGSFFWGYALTGIPGGMLSERWGGKYFYGLGIGATALFTVLTPVATRGLDLVGILVVRFLEGLFEGVTLPAMHALLHKWAPEEDRSWMVAVTFAGTMVGTVITYPLGGFLCDSDFLDGWPGAFYLFGGVGLLWTVAWVFVAFESPLTHPWISVREREFLRVACHLRDTSHERPLLPVRQLLTSMPFYAICVAHFSFNWGYYSMLTLLPKYMTDVLHFAIKDNGLILALPYIAHTVLLLSTSFLADYLKTSGRLSRTQIRKFAHAFGFLVPAAALGSIYLAGCNRVVVIVLLVMAVACQAFGISGFYVNHFDLAPPFAGTMMGVTNMIGTVPGIVSPYLAGAIVEGRKSSRFAWMIVFLIAVGIYLVGLAFYSVFGSGELQSWASLPDNEEHTSSAGDGGTSRNQVSPRDDNSNGFYKPPEQSSTYTPSFDQHQQQYDSKLENNTSIPMQRLDPGLLATAPRDMQQQVAPSTNHLFTNAYGGPLLNGYGYPNAPGPSGLPTAPDSQMPYTGYTSVGAGVVSPQLPPRYAKEPLTMTLPSGSELAPVRTITAPPLPQTQQMLQAASTTLTAALPASGLPPAPQPEQKPLTSRVFPSVQQQQQQGVTSFVYADQDDSYVKGLVAGKETFSI